MMLAVIFFGFFSPAADAGLCHPPEDLRKRVQSCMNNALYSEAAVRCLHKFTGQVDMATRKAGQSMAAAVGGMSQAQRENLTTSQDSYQISREALHRLTLLGRAARGEVNAYADEIVFPEELGDAGGDIAPLLEATHCYQRNQDVLAAVLADFDRKLAELGQAADTAEKLQSAASTSGRNLGEGGLRGRAAAKGRGDGQAMPTARPSGLPSTGGSDITGTERLQKKKLAP